MPHLVGGLFQTSLPLQGRSLSNIKQSASFVSLLFEPKYIWFSWEFFFKQAKGLMLVAANVKSFTRSFIRQIKTLQIHGSAEFWHKVKVCLFFLLEVLPGPKMMDVAPITWRWSSRSALLLPQTNQIPGPPVEQCRNGPAPIHPKIPFFQIKRRPRSKVSLGRTSTEEGDGRDPSSEKSRFF